MHYNVVLMLVQRLWRWPNIGNFGRGLSIKFAGLAYILLIFYPLEAVDRGSETQLQVGDNSSSITLKVKKRTCHIIRHKLFLILALKKRGVFWRASKEYVCLICICFEPAIVLSHENPTMPMHRKQVRSTLGAWMRVFCGVQNASLAEFRHFLSNQSDHQRWSVLMHESLLHPAEEGGYDGCCFFLFWWNSRNDWHPLPMP